MRLDAAVSSEEDGTSPDVWRKGIFSYRQFSGEAGFYVNPAHSGTVEIAIVALQVKPFDGQLSDRPLWHT